jgi:hypothetical protein
MGDRENQQVKVYQTQGKNSIEDMNVFLTNNKIDRNQIINYSIGYFPISAAIDTESQFETVMTIVYNDIWKG